MDKYLRQEEAGRVAVAGLLGGVNNLQIQVNPIGVIPKKGRVNCWRLIIDLSAPRGGSVNDGISKATCSLHYVSVEYVAARVVELGRDTLLRKMDIEQACLLGMCWKSKVYVDKYLPFGLWSAPLIFSAVADALQWIMDGALH